MALGSLAALTPVELVFMGKKKKKITPGWSRQGDQPAGGSTEVLRAGYVYGPEHLVPSSPSILGLHGAHSSHSAVAITSSRKPS